ncbi:MAG: hypothetical protein H0W64_05850 [Gammaproteobacteria bacterium]|nr:hypothetical protein [Gammaproteobacteria bacterium]
MHRLTYYYALQYALRVSIAVGAAFLLTYFNFFGERAYWIVMSAFLVVQASRIMPITAALRSLIIIITVYLCGYFTLIITHNFFVAYFVLMVTYLLTGTVALVMQPLRNKLFNLALIPLFIFLMMFFNPGFSTMRLQSDLLQILIGGLIGGFCSCFIFPQSLFQSFRNGVLPVIERGANYLSAIEGQLMQEVADRSQLIQSRLNFMHALQANPGPYPEWVFDIGFNMGLRSGYRYFLVHLGRLTELIFSMNYLASFPLSAELLANLRDQLIQTLQKNQNLLATLRHYFQEGILHSPEGDFTQDLIELENELKKYLPQSLDLLDLSPDYLTATAVVRDLKDIRHELLQLLLTLPNVPVNSPVLLPSV